MQAVNKLASWRYVAVFLLLLVSLVTYSVLRIPNGAGVDGETRLSKQRMTSSRLSQKSSSSRLSQKSSSSRLSQKSSSSRLSQQSASSKKIRYLLQNRLDVSGSQPKSTPAVIRQIATETTQETTTLTSTWLSELPTSTDGPDSTTTDNSKEEVNTKLMINLEGRQIIQLRRGGRNDDDDSDGEEWTQHLPHALLIGQKKCGTATFKNFFNQNPYISSAVREAHFFDDNNTYSRGLEHYLKRIKKSKPGQLTMEGSPRYFYTPWVPERVHAMNESIKLLVILCDPTRRLVSDYVHLQNHEDKALKKMDDNDAHMMEMQTIDLVRKFGRYPTFGEAVFAEDGTIDTKYTGVANGLYINILRRWLKYFPLEQIHVIDASNFLKKPWVELNKAARFIGIPDILTSDNFYIGDKGYYCKVQDHGGGCMNKGKGREHPVIPEEQMDKIRQFYHPYNEELYELLGRDLHWQ